jgi:hypothetical protein
LLGKPVLESDIFFLDPSKLARLLPERLRKDRATGSSALIQETYAEDFPVCCASASETFARKRVASSQRVNLFFMFFFSARASCLLPLFT